MNPCLILVDLQNDYFPGGRMELMGIAAAAANAGRLVDHFRRAGSAIIHVQHLSVRPGASFFLPETDGAAINAAVAPREDEPVVVKHYPNAFRATALLEMLHKRGISDVTVCGAMSHMCIDATVRAAFDLGLACTVVEDACATTHLTFANRVIDAADVHASFMAALSGTYATVVSTSELTGAQVRTKNAG